MISTMIYEVEALFFFVAVHVHS